MSNERFYADEYEEDWFVFDSEQEPERAVSSWSCEQDAKDDAARRNELEMSVGIRPINFKQMKLADASDKVTGIELIRRASNLFGNGSETFAERFDTYSLLKIAQGYIACKWDFHPEQWEERQIIDLLVFDKIPEWDDNEDPMYD